MAASVSMTMQQDPSLVLVLTSWKGTLLKLPDILETYHDWDDLLSQKMITWIREVIRTAGSYEGDIDKISEVAREKIRELRDGILVTEYKRRPLRDPQLVRSWTWEKESLDLYRLKRGDLSPHDGKKIESKEHLFAKAMLDWMSNTPLGREREELHLACVEALNPKQAEEEVIMYGLAYRSHMEARRLQQNQKHIQAVEKTCSETLALMEVKLGEQAIRFKAELEAERDKIDVRFKSTLKNCEESMALVEEKVVRAESQKAELVQKLNVLSQEARETKEATELMSAKISELQHAILLKTAEVERLRDSCKVKKVRTCSIQ
jgi:hypothetical protein